MEWGVGLLTKKKILKRKQISHCFTWIYETMEQPSLCGRVRWRAATQPKNLATLRKCLSCRKAERALRRRAKNPKPPKKMSPPILTTSNVT